MKDSRPPYPRRQPFDHERHPDVRTLPIVPYLSEISSLLETRKKLVLSAEPGAGKSTVVPLSILGRPWLSGRKILVLEPRRLAAAGIAARMADLLGEKIGDRAGYRVRFENRTGKDTRIEVITEALLTRMFQSDPTLDEVGLIIFDEFHERSLHGDLGLAFALEARELRDDLRILVMSATIDTSRIAAF